MARVRNPSDLIGLLVGGIVALFVVGILLALASLKVWQPLMAPFQYASAFAFIGAAMLPILAAPLAIIYGSGR